MSEAAGVLALDLASKTGYAHSTAGSGVWAFKGTRPEKWASLRDVLTRLLKQHPTSRVVIEAPHHRGGAATLFLVGMAAMAELAAFEQGAEFSSVHSSTLKKHATGSGKASKEDMVKAASSITQVIDDNHADALLLLELATCTSTKPCTSCRKRAQRP